MTLSLFFFSIFFLSVWFGSLSKATGEQTGQSIKRFQIKYYSTTHSNCFTGGQSGLVANNVSTAANFVVTILVPHAPKSPCKKQNSYVLLVFSQNWLVDNALHKNLCLDIRTLKDREYIIYFLNQYISMLNFVVN